MIRLLLKTYSNHKKYLCKTIREDFLEYRGSGLMVTDDIELIDTEILFETEDKNLFREVALYYSNLWSVDTNSLFLNISKEEGQGGNTGNYSKASMTRKENMEEKKPTISFLKKYQKRFRFKFVDNKPGQNLSNKSLKELEDMKFFVIMSFGDVETIDWNYDGRGRTKNSEQTKAKMRQSAFKAWTLRKAGT